MLLSIRERAVGQRDYLPPKDLLWDISQGATLTSLRRAVMAVVKESEDNLLLAKHFRDKFEWIILKDKEPDHSQQVKFQFGFILTEKLNF